jgi:hypothetical protein
VCSRSGFLRSWKWIVESHDAEMRSAGILVSKYCFEQGEVPTVLFAIDYLFDRSSMCAEYCLLSRLEIYSKKYSILAFVNMELRCSLPLHLPVHTRAESFIVVRSEAYIEYGCSMLILLNQLAPRFLV